MGTVNRIICSVLLMLAFHIILNGPGAIKTISVAYNANTNIKYREGADFGIE